MYNKFVVEDCFPLDIMKEWQENEEPGSLFIQEQERTCMKKELEYFYIENSFGGNQDWFRDYWMHMGGCAAAAACDSCISMEKVGVKKKLYPFDIKNLNKSDYLDFSMLMKRSAGYLCGWNGEVSSGYWQYGFAVGCLLRFQSGTGSNAGGKESD